ncbi:MAG: transcription antitermination factor NusB [Pseudomonadota bacterium]
MKSETSIGAKTRARELLLQALYQRQIAGHGADELLEQFHLQAAYQRVDKHLFDTLLPAIVAGEPDLNKTIDGLIDRPIEQLDPVELVTLMIGVYELTSSPEVPYRVVINEGVNLAKRFGAIDGHKYINACLDKAANSLRAEEVESKRGG